MAHLVKVVGLRKIKEVDGYFDAIDYYLDVTVEILNNLKPLLAYWYIYQDEFRRQLDSRRPSEQEYFRRKLQNWREELLKESEETLESLQEGGVQEPDLADRASTEMERSLELRTRDRARKLISKIDAAIRRIEEGTYGYCEETGEPISLKRLEARPIATLSIEAQERHERMERTHRSD